MKTTLNLNISVFHFMSVLSVDLKISKSCLKRFINPSLAQLANLSHYLHTSTSFVRGQSCDQIKVTKVLKRDPAFFLAWIHIRIHLQALNNLAKNITIKFFPLINIYPTLCLHYSILDQKRIKVFKYFFKFTNLFDDDLKEFFVHFTGFGTAF